MHVYTQFMSVKLQGQVWETMCIDTFGLNRAMLRDIQKKKITNASKGLFTLVLSPKEQSVVDLFSNII